MTEQPHIPPTHRQETRTWRRRRCAFAWLVWLISMVSVPSARGEGYSFIKYLPAQGLSQSQVTCLLQDSTGYLWIGTVAGGLNRFDGKQFTTYRWADGLEAVFIRALVEYRGQLYVGTRRGLFRQNGERFESIPSRSGRVLDIYDLTVSPDDELVVSTAEGLFTVQEDTIVADRRGRLLPRGSVHEAVFLRPDELWVLGREWDQGAFWFGYIRGLTFNPVTLPEGILIDCVLPDPSGGLWVGTRDGLYHTEGRKLRLVPLDRLRQPISSLYLDPSGTLWVGTWRGVASLSGETLSVLDVSTGFPSVRVRAILEDREGNLFFGTDGEGLLQLPPQPFARYSVPEMGDYAAMDTVVDRAGRRWIATFGQGLWYIEDDSAHRVGKEHGEALLDCTALLLKDDDTLWVGTNTSGLFQIRLTPPFETSVIPDVGSASILDLAEAGGRYFVANEDGLFVLENDRWTRYGEEDGLPSHYPTYVTHRQDGTLWIGTYDKGLFRWDPETREVVDLIGRNQGLPCATVTSVIETAGGDLYIGTYQGLVRRRGRTIKLMGRREGLPDETINFIVAEPETGRLWVGTNRGVAQQVGSGWRSFTHRQGLPDDETNTGAATWDEQGRLWVGTIHGYGVLVRRPPPINPVPPPVVIQQVWEHDRPLDPRGTGMEFRYNQNRLRFRFVGLSYVDPARVRYRYRLAGHEDSDWTETDQNEVSFAALEPGVYTFEVLACNNDGLWATVPARFSFVIHPPIWATWWARALAVALVLLTGVGIYTVRMSHMVRQQRWLEQQVEDRTYALKKEKERSEQLLLNILPAPIAGELMERGVAAPRLYADVTILYADFQEFTRGSTDLSPQELVEQLQEIGDAFDEICRVHRLEKLKTVGDAFMAASGLPVKNPNHAREAVEAALEMQEYLEARFTVQGRKRFRLRIGLHSGPVVAGVIGTWKFAFDIWGDAVNTASRMEALGKPGRVNISRTTYEKVRAYYVCESRGHVATEGKGTIEMFFVKARREGPVPGRPVRTT